LATIYEASLVTRPLAGSAPRCLRAVGRTAKAQCSVSARRNRNDLEMQERPVRIETEADLADRLHAALADEGVLSNHVYVAEMPLERVVVPNTGRTDERVN